MSMTPEAKSALARTIRGTSTSTGGLRQRLLEDLHNATETAYRLSVRAQNAGLDEAARTRRRRFEAWIDEQRRAQGAAKPRRTADDFRRDAEKQAAYTWLNRIIVLRLMEGAELRGPKVVTGGWESRGYQDFRSIAQALVRGDKTEGYAYLLGLVFEDLATELPGVFGVGGSAGMADLVPMPAATLRHLVEALDDDVLETCWTDDMTLGWVYQYWNDPEREALDAKLNSGGKVERHEIASKTQMFTERYMVDWLLQNSLGPMWPAMCQKHGWTPEVQSDGTLDRLDERRVDWRAKREARPDNGGVELTALMPLHTDAERRWAYYVPQPIPDDAVAHAPESVRDLKLIDPAVGSGHFLVVAFDLLVAFYREEARHRGEAGEAKWTDRAIVERILEHNLHGIDLDPRAVQIAAAALWLKAKTVSTEAKPKRLNVVAANLRLSSLPDDDPALLELRRKVERETGIPAALTDTIIGALKGADHLGSLLKIDSAVDEALLEMEGQLGRAEPAQGDLLAGFPAEKQRLTMSADAAKESLLERLEGFLSKHTSGDDLGLRLRGEQLAAGVRFLRLVKEETYDLVVANPPYQGTSKMGESKYVQKRYPLGKADLFAAFLERGLQLVQRGGVSAMLTMRNWMFIKQFSTLRTWLLKTYDVRALGDFAVGAFDEVPNDLLSVVVSVFHKTPPVPVPSVAQQPTPPDDLSYDRARTKRKRAAALCHVGRHEFDTAALKVVPEWPLVYWWGEDRLEIYHSSPLIGDEAPARQGLATADNTRFLRQAFEAMSAEESRWWPYIKGGEGAKWFEPIRYLVNWSLCGLEIHVFERNGKQASRPQNIEFYFQIGVAFSPIGSTFAARLHRTPSIFGHMGSSVFPLDLPQAVCRLNSYLAGRIVQSLNPGVHFEIGDVNRLPAFTVNGATEIVGVVARAFTTHESHREASVEFTHPGPSPWRHAQDWAQAAVDRPEADPLPEYIEELDFEPPTDHVSFTLGVALGRFGPNQEGILDPDNADLSHAFPAGICFLDGTLTEDDRRDSLGHPAATPLHDAWATHGSSIDAKRDLRTWLRLKFFSDVHKGMYENRPIHWPLCSAKKTFVAWVNIHRMNECTLRVLLADRLHPALTRLEGQLSDLRDARDGADTKAAREAEKRFDSVLKAKNELSDFIDMVTQCSDRGAPPTDPNPTKCPPRKTDARYDPDLDDGVMINSAALWPLLLPLWKEPKKWWKELSLAKGRKDYDWSHLAMRYWPTRVDAKCQKDPSLGVAHGCFWAYHPERAWAWELRLQDEIGPDFRIEETSYRGDGGDPAHRTAYLRNHAKEALAAVEKEALRRLKNLRKPVYEAEIKRLEADGVATKKAKKLAKALAEKTHLTSLTLLESGLWSEHGKACLALEHKITTKQKAPFLLLASDAPDRPRPTTASSEGTSELPFGDES